MNNVVLQGCGLSKGFGVAPSFTQVLHAVDCRFQAGEMALLMGPSGSGKSTLLAILSGLLRPDSGTVLAKGRSLGEMTESELLRWRLDSVGFVFQHDNLLPSLTIRQQLEMLLTWGLGMPGRQSRERVMDLLGLFGIESKANLRPAALSGGERQRASIARALLKRPELCFADEPTSALDWKTGKNVVDAMRRASHENGMTTVVVTHDQRLLPYADSVYMLEDGVLSRGHPTPQHGDMS